MLEALGGREVPIPEHIDIYHLSEEIAASDRTPLQCVMQVESERVRLEAEAAQLVEEGDSESDRLMDIYERLEVIDSSTAESKAAKILHGLGFSKGGSMRVVWVCLCVGVGMRRVCGGKMGMVCGCDQTVIRCSNRVSSIC